MGLLYVICKPVITGKSSLMILFAANYPILGGAWGQGYNSLGTRPLKNRKGD